MRIVCSYRLLVMLSKWLLYAVFQNDGRGLISWYCFIHESGRVILSYNGRKTVKVFISWKQLFCFLSLLRHSVKFVKWRLPCTSHFVCCSVQLLQSLKPADLVARKNVRMEIQHTLAHYDDLFTRSVFNDEASFHLSHKVNRHNVWEEFRYRLDVCRVTNGAHIEHL